MIYNIPNCSLGDGIFSCELALLAALSGILFKNLASLFVRQFRGGIVVSDYRKHALLAVLFCFESFRFGNKSGNNSGGGGLPVSARQNIPNRGLSDSIFCRKRILFTHFSRITRSNFKDLAFGQLRRGVVFSLRRMIVSFVKITRSLLNHVLRILCLSSKSKVIWTYAPRNVFSWALVQNKQTFWNWASAQNPRSDMGIDVASVSASVIFNATPDASVVHGGTPVAIPQPMCRGDKNSFPKALWKTFGKSLFSEVSRVNVRLHSFAFKCGLCRVPGCSFSAGTFSLCHGAV